MSGEAPHMQRRASDISGHDPPGIGSSLSPRTTPERYPTRWLLSSARTWSPRQLKRHKAGEDRAPKPRHARRLDGVDAQPPPTAQLGTGDVRKTTKVRTTAQTVSPSETTAPPRRRRAACVCVCVYEMHKATCIGATTQGLDNARHLIVGLKPGRLDCRNRQHPSTSTPNVSDPEGVGAKPRTQPKGPAIA